ncbi:BRO-N domain-containing protein [Bacillus tropicus]|uniref:BRO-N domain-containing protein n=1 Tax=Bacillus tropicus TaxID=2026188 RepID=UPI002079728E|nr:Bro-N domain-containing protein [Bacillus tropicus]USK98219.1 Bro-N domain-containing protein [Bacillus tropicus]
MENEEIGKVRTVAIGKEHWVIAKDVCDVLSIGNITKTISRLDEDEFTTSKVTDSTGRNQDTFVINESDLYLLIMTSCKLQVKAFKKWVPSEVLPRSYKTGK